MTKPALVLALDTYSTSGTELASFKVNYGEQGEKQATIELLNLPIKPQYLAGENLLEREEALGELIDALAEWRRIGGRIQG